MNIRSVLRSFSGEDSSTHLLLPRRVPLLRVFAHRALVQPGLQHAHGGVSVLQLRAALLTLGCRPCEDTKTDEGRGSVVKSKRC